MVNGKDLRYERFSICHLPFTHVNTSDRENP